MYSRLNEISHVSLSFGIETIVNINCDITSRSFYWSTHIRIGCNITIITTDINMASAAISLSLCAW